MMHCQFAYFRRQHKCYAACALSANLVADDALDDTDFDLEMLRLSFLLDDTCAYVLQLQYLQGRMYLELLPRDEHPITIIVARWHGDGINVDVCILHHTLPPFTRCICRLLSHAALL